MLGCDGVLGRPSVISHLHMENKASSVIKDGPSYDASTMWCPASELCDLNKYLLCKPHEILLKSRTRYAS